jgi:hypothetical protein
VCENAHIGSSWIYLGGHCGEGRQIERWRRFSHQLMPPVDVCDDDNDDGERGKISN